MDNQEIRKKLQELSEPEYQRFSSALLPETKNILGVRLPHLRKVAKQIVKGDWRAYLEQAQDGFFEEVMLQGMVIGYAKADLSELLQFVQSFIPKIDNWSVCDSFCAGLKIAKEYPLQMWEFFQPYLYSKSEFEVRFGLVMILNYFIREDYIEKVFGVLDDIRHSGYYSKMAAAWAVSVCYVKFPQRTMEYLRCNNLDMFTYQKALQKIIESRQISDTEREIIRKMKNQ